MFDLIIIGAGPAGLTAGIYAGRFMLSTLIIEKISIGGQIILSPSIDNYPGFPEGIATSELIDRFHKQLVSSGVKVVSEEVLGISPENIDGKSVFNIKASEKTYTAKSVIVATGARPKQFGIKGEERFIGRGVSYCATCDGPLFKGKDLLVVGGGDRALEEALFLTGYAKTVSILHRRNELRASKILVEKASKNNKINFILNSTLEEIQGENKVEQVLIRDTRTNATRGVTCQGVFIFVGIIPNTEILKNFLEIDAKGFIITDTQMATSCPGIFACGDCRQKSLYQVITACGEGAQGADSAHKYLLSQ